MHSRWWDFGGDTVIRTDKYIRLTANSPSQQGWIWSRLPLTATNWEIEFEFKIHGSGHLHGDGFAMWLTKQRATTGPVFGSVDRFEGLGIFFDTYKNNRPGVTFPYVMAMMGDGQTAYDQEHDGKANELAGCSARGIREASIATRARLTYFQDKYLKLELNYKSDGSWTECFTLNAPDYNINIPSVSYLGFTGETGEVSDFQDIISVNAQNLYTVNPDQPRARGTTSGKGRRNKSSGGWGWFSVKVFLFLGAIVGSYVGYTIYRSGKRGSRF